MDAQVAQRKTRPETLNRKLIEEMIHDALSKIMAERQAPPDLLPPPPSAVPPRSRILEAAGIPASRRYRRSHGKRLTIDLRVMSAEPHVTNRTRVSFHDSSGKWYIWDGSSSFAHSLRDRIGVQVRITGSVTKLEHGVTYLDRVLHTPEAPLGGWTPRT